jgi:hypothetical protein
MDRSQTSPRRMGTATTAALVLLALAGGEAAAQDDASGGLPGEWLSRYSGARTTGLGGAYVASAGDPLGMLWNPAGLARMFQNEASFEATRLFEGTSLYGFGLAIPNRALPSFGLSVVSLRSGEFEKTNDLNEPAGAFREGNVAFVLSGSKQIHPRVSVGMNAKVVRQMLDEFDAAGFGADFGVLFDVTNTVRLGASVLNVGGPKLTFRSTEESYPSEIRTGMNLKMLGGRGVVSTELDWRHGTGTSLHAGTEFWIHRNMALRVGYYENDPTGGFSYRFSPDVRFDYGVSNHTLGVTNRLGISYSFGGFFARSRANPPVFSPLGEQAVTKFELESHTKGVPAEWSLRIYDESERVVRRFAGQSEPPSHVMWDGKGENGLPLPDGAYRYEFSVRDELGHEILAKVRTVEITTTGPRGSIPVTVQ